MADQQQGLHPLREGNINGIPQIVGTLDNRDICREWELLLQKVQPVVARHCYQILHSVFRSLADLKFYRVDNGLLTHRLYNTGSAEDGNPAFDAEHRVEGLAGNLLSFGDRDDNIQPACITGLCTDCLRGGCDHPARN